MGKEEMIPVGQYCTHYNVEITFIRSLQEAGLVSISTLEDENYLHYDELRNLEKFIRLHLDLDINPEGIEAISHMLERMEAMQQEMVHLKNRLRIYEQSM